MNMRIHVNRLEERGLLQRVSKPVDRNWEIGSMARWLYHGLDEEDRFGLLFEDVNGFEIPVMTSVLGASRDTYALALDVEPNEIHSKWRDALNNPLEPETVEDGPVHDVVKTGSDASLDEIPIPIWTPRKDAGPYVTALVFTKNRETEVQNVATYRCEVKDGRTIAINITPGRHGYMDFESYAKDDDPAPVAIAIAAEPTAHLGSIANLAYGRNEMEVAGGLLGDPLEHVHAKTVDIEVLANAEIVIEGEIHPTQTEEEGPFGEFAGYMGEVFQKPIFDVTAITHRTDPMYYGYISQMPPSESTCIQSISNAAMYHKQLSEDLGHRVISDVHINGTYGGLLAHAFVRMEPQYPSHAAEVGRTLADISALKQVTVVDEDVDIRDPEHVDWAMNSRFNPQHDITVIEDVYLPAVLDPSVQFDAKGRPVTSKLVIDATEDMDMEDGKPVVNLPDLSLPPREIMHDALESWEEAELPELSPKKRMELMLEAHPGEKPGAER